MVLIFYVVAGSIATMMLWLCHSLVRLVCYSAWAKWLSMCSMVDAVKKRKFLQGFLCFARNKRSATFINHIAKNTSLQPP